MMVITLYHFQKRIADISIGNTTLRKQGKGATKVAIDYLKKLPLNKLSNINEGEFVRLLDEFTTSLQTKIPNNSWGAARKAINIFLFQASCDLHLVQEYQLDKIIPYLELPLDNPNAERLKKEAKKEGIKLKWKNIKGLTPEENKELQKYALKYAKEKHNCERCYLDLIFWRSEEIRE